MRVERCLERLTPLLVGHTGGFRPAGRRPPAGGEETLVRPLGGCWKGETMERIRACLAQCRAELAGLDLTRSIVASLVGTAEQAAGEAVCQKGGRGQPGPAAGPDPDQPPDGDPGDASAAGGGVLADHRGGEYPSRWLAGALFGFQEVLTGWFRRWAPDWLHGALVLGAYRTLAWVVSVMLPPMAIFFPLFTLLEDFGYLPRVAFVLDHALPEGGRLRQAGADHVHGFRRNAAGVVGCRIIDSPGAADRHGDQRPGALQRRFPTLIAILTMFFVGVDGGPLRGWPVPRCCWAWWCWAWE